MMKRFLLILCLFGLRSVAQDILINGGTNFVGALGVGATNAYNLAIDASQQTYVAFQVNFKCTGTNVDTIAFNVYPLLDGTNAATASSHFKFGISANGTTPVTFETNYLVGATRQLVLSSVGNPNTNGIVTNLVVAVHKR